tara:strand:- start:210 stop:698 length:489 start_codon:yes stop_codon:yes gene_type:complete
MTEKIESWVYLGQRENGDGKIIHAWAEFDDAVKNGLKAVEMWFPRRCGADVVGAVYEIPITREIREGDDEETVSGTFSEKKMVSTLKHNGHGTDFTKEWRILHAAAKGLRTQKIAEKKLAAESEDIGDLTLKEVGDVISKLGPAQRRAAIARVLQVIDERWW